MDSSGHHSDGQNHVNLQIQLGHNVIVIDGLVLVKADQSGGLLESLVPETIVRSSLVYRT